MLSIDLGLKINHVRCNRSYSHGSQKGPTELFYSCLKPMRKKCVFLFTVKNQIGYSRLDVRELHFYFKVWSLECLASEKRIVCRKQEDDCLGQGHYNHNALYRQHQQGPERFWIYYHGASVLEHKRFTRVYLRWLVTVSSIFQEFDGSL